MIFVVSCLLVISLYMCNASTVTLTVGDNHVPAQIIVTNRDRLTIVNTHSSRIHRFAAPQLAHFDTGDLYPAALAQLANGRETQYTYDFKDVAVGEYLYADQYTRNGKLQGKIIVSEYGCPWDDHPGYSGPREDAGPTRIIGARVVATRNNGENQITPASVRDVQVQVFLAGAGEALLRAKLRGDQFTLGDQCLGDEQRRVDAFNNAIETFSLDARSLPDGDLDFEIELNGETYLLPGPVVKRVQGAEFPTDGNAKKIVNIVLAE